MPRTPSLQSLPPPPGESRCGEGVAARRTPTLQSLAATAAASGNGARGHRLDTGAHFAVRPTWRSVACAGLLAYELVLQRMGWLDFSDGTPREVSDCSNAVNPRWGGSCSRPPGVATPLDERAALSLPPSLQSLPSPPGESRCGEGVAARRTPTLQSLAATAAASGDGARGHRLDKGAHFAVRPTRGRSRLRCALVARPSAPVRVRTEPVPGIPHPPGYRGAGLESPYLEPPPSNRWPRRRLRRATALEATDWIRVRTLQCAQPADVLGSGVRWWLARAPRCACGRSRCLAARL